jgi:hypothetical protein
MAVYKSTAAQGGATSRRHDTYFGARSNEFGYANYEILLEGPANLTEVPKGDNIPAEDQAKFLHVPVVQE